MINRRVLVIDDDATVLETYRSVLGGRTGGVATQALHAFLSPEKGTGSGHAEPFALTEASQGAEGVEAVRQSLAEGEPYAVAFVDMRMPPGINGLETARQIRDLDDRIHIVIVTAYSDHSVDEMQASLHHDLLLTRKPLTSEEILQLARNACNSWSKGAADRARFDSILQQLASMEEQECTTEAPALWWG
ncbi:MAG: response regulator [Magnetococcus sp. YQC-3]